jgi:phage tail sheath protein FI
MPEYLSPGVYVEEVDTGNKPIEGVATSTLGFIGLSERGPTAATLVTSFSEYKRQFGSYRPNYYLAQGIEGFFQNGGKRAFVARVFGTGALPSTLAIAPVTVSAAGPGTWGNRVFVKVTNSGVGDPNLFKLTVIYYDEETFAGPPALTQATHIDPTNPKSLLPSNVANRREPTLVEVYDNLSFNPVASSFYERRVNNASALVRLATAGAPARPANNADEITNPGALTAGQIPTLAGGTDGAALALANATAALDLLEAVDEIAILCCPDEHSQGFAGITDPLVNQCENLKDRFAILQAPPGAAPATLAVPRDTKYAGFYYPWIEIRHARLGIPVLIPPGGHVAGIYARSDIERGVHKAPANEVVRGLFNDPENPKRGLERQVTKGEHDILNPKGINVIRNFPGRGNVLWGARTMSRDPDWKYVNVRRLFIFMEESIEEATQWVVFEPNDEPLWARVRRSVSDFLTRLWMDGMLQGRSKEEAYFVRCDRTTMTQADIDNGRLIMLIGVAPVKPAEFVIFRIGQWTGGSDVSEG